MTHPSLFTLAAAFAPALIQINFYFAAGSGPVTGHGVAQGGLQITQPRLEMGPGVEAISENRLAHLLGTGGADAAPVLVEIEAGLFERQAAIVQNAPNLALKILDHVFMLHAQHPARQRRIPVLHQVKIGAVIAGYVLDAVGKLLPLGEELFQIGEMILALGRMRWMSPICLKLLGILSMK